MCPQNPNERIVSSQCSRRGFLEKSALLAAGTAAGLSFARSAHAAGNDIIKIGLIGCGGRGTGAAAQALNADPATQLVAMGDAFANQLESSLKNLRADPAFASRVVVDKEHCFVGLDAYQKVLESGVDMVLLAAPGGFRPLHLKASIDAGKHVFCEKPMAVDGPGLRTVIAAVAEAKRKKLAIRAGLCFRFDPTFQETFKRLHDGAIGDILAIYGARMGGSLTAKFNGQRKPGWGDLEWQMRNWSNFSWLSGDWMMEVACHEIDKIAWAMRDVPPVKCLASGGRSTPVFGNIFDHFDVTYEYENGTPAIMKSRYEDGCAGDYKHLIIGTKGRCTLGWCTAVITGPNAWNSKKAKISPTNMYDVEHQTLFHDLRAGNPPNDGDRMVKSVLMSLMGRMSAYSGQEITWDKAMNSKENTMPANLSWDMKLPVSPLPVPGITPFV
jgi:predicted dehydrogenase